MPAATKKAVLPPLIHPIICRALPKEIAKCGDLLYSTRQERLKVQKIVEALEEQESKLKAYIIDNLPKSSATGISGEIAHVKVESEPIPVVENWDKFYAFIVKTKSFEFLQRRISVEAVKERWNKKIVVPGVNRLNVKKVSCTKI